MEKEIKRDYYLEQLIKRKGNGLIKIVTGSNAKFLSRDIATEFGGRGDEVHMYPLSFSGFMTAYDGNRYDGWNEYITYGGIPLVVLAETEEQKMTLLDNLFKETYISDIVKRNKIRNVGQMEVTHSMENVIYNELRMRGFSVDVGNQTIVENKCRFFRIIISHQNGVADCEKKCII